MVSRLDRLFILLDTGSNESVRLAAAKQLGEVQRIQPNDLEYLLQRIKEYSGKSVWETRVATGHATRCVLEQVGPWPLPESTQIHDLEEDKARSQLEIADRLVEQNVDTKQIFNQFDLDKIVSLYPKLLSLDISDIDDLELVNASGSKGASRGKKDSSSTSRGQKRKNDKEQLMRQRKLINKELGISMVDSLNLGVKSTDIVSNDDLQTEYEIGESSTTTSKSQPTNLQDTRNALQQSFSNYDKVLDKLTQAECISKVPSSLNHSNKDNQANFNAVDPPPGHKWPLTNIVKLYTEDLFNPSWEIRHGAAIALREIVKLQGKYAGRRSDLTTSSNDLMNQLWLIDMSLRALSVLALDKFGDFLFDQVVAPVRENAAQLLGCCVANMSGSNAHSVIQIILKMLENPNWETRHGGILGLKYSLNVVSESFSKKILQECFEPIFKCLGDPVDDVSAEAAASLVPVKDLMIETIPDKAPKLIKFLWDHLADLDELTTSTSNIVLLLASLITSSSAQLEPKELTKSIPRLWSLLGHSSTTVRLSVLKALITLIKPQRSSCLIWMDEELMTTALRLVFQRSILENMEEVRPYIEEVWMHLIKINDDTSNSQSERFKLLKCTSQFLNYWLCLIMQPSTSPIDRSASMWLNIGPDGSESSTKPNGEVYICSCTFNAESLSQQKLQVTKCRLLATRLIGSLYANLINDFSDSVESQHSKETLKYLADMFIHYMKTKSANQRIISGWAIESWASRQNDLLSKDNEKLKTILPKNLVDQLNSALQENTLIFDELATIFTRLQQETKDFVASIRTMNINPNFPDKTIIYNLVQIHSLCHLNLENEQTRAMSVKKPATTVKVKLEQTSSATGDKCIELLNKQANLKKSLQSANQAQKCLSTSVLSSLACAHISWRLMPDRIKLITQPLLDSIELEEEQPLQDKSINYLVILFDILSANLDQYNNLLEEMLGRLIDVLNCKSLALMHEPVGRSILKANNDPPVDSSAMKEVVVKGQQSVDNGSDNYKIIQLDNLQRKAELTRTMSRRQSSISAASSLKRSHSTSASTDIDSDTISSAQTSEDMSQRSSNDVQHDIQHRGASLALKKLANHFGQQLPEKLPRFWNSITRDIKSQIQADHRSRDDEIQLIKNLQLLASVGESLSIELRKHLLDLFIDLIQLLNSPNPTIRHYSSQCIGLISKLMFSSTVNLINKHIIPLLEQENTLTRCGSIETIALIIEHLQLGLVPRIDMFIIHVLRRMSDQNDQVRLMATHCFGKLLSLMPLNLNKATITTAGSNDGDILNQQLGLVKHDDQRFMEQLLNPKKLDNFDIPFEMRAELRSYQQEGLNWLNFLNRFNLHGILCDEMGLGKTLMTICIVASDHFLLASKTDNATPTNHAPSLIVCPSTLTEHWLYEIEKFLPDKKVLNPVSYSGILTDRMSIRCQIISNFNKNSKEINSPASDDKSSLNYNLVVASYDIVRNDIDFFKSISWNYCVLDEGHIIKNGKTKLSRAIRLLNAKHRLILSGTPIQNNVTELWSLFDFLMPGFLGSDRQFNSRYAKPILQSREPKCSSRELEAGALAMESLHRQVLPFILRRLKEDVLDDLPPKIIQDYYCELSSLQHKLYEDFTHSKLCKDVTKRSIRKLDESGPTDADDGLSATNQNEVKSTSKSHVFQALQYLKNVCNHPKLVLTEKHSQYLSIKKSLDSEKSSLDDIAHSSKLNALKQLLLDCGIGIVNQPGDEQQQQQQQPLAFQSVVNQHRALVFCQLRSMVDIIENDLLKKHLPTVTYLKLDGSVPSNQRQSIVSRFNNDPSIDILLLTTQIGGLGLNLTGADTVIFVEHDWNPTKDLQAMDRAHRIGQKKVVNVYRLITKGTLEEKIMGLQKFKTMVSNTVINQDNAGLRTMNVDQLFDLFEDTTASAAGDTTNSGRADTCRYGDSGSVGVKSKSSFMDLLPELWDQQQYETEYDLSNFVSSLKN